MHFSLSDLEKQGKLSSDVLFPWKRATDSIMKIARDNRQTYVYVWFPYRFGKRERDDPHRHQNVIQQVLPTRTGYPEIRSETVVWLSAVNLSRVLREEEVVRKPWTEDDHWTHYKKPAADDPRSSGGSTGHRQGEL